MAAKHATLESSHPYSVLKAMLRCEFVYYLQDKTVDGGTDGNLDLAANPSLFTQRQKSTEAVSMSVYKR